MSDILNRSPADLLIVLAHHVGELDAFFPLIFLLRQSHPAWRTRVIVTKKTLMRQLNQSPALLSMMASLEIAYRFIPVNVTNDPAELHSPVEVKGSKVRRFLSRIAGRLCSYLVMVRSIPALICELGSHKSISVEGTQYPLLISLTCLFAYLDKRTVFLHNHSVQPILSLPQVRRLIIGKRFAKGIVFSNTELSRDLYGEKLRNQTYRTGLLKYLPEWTAFCQSRVTSQESTALGVFAKRISFEVYHELLKSLLSRLAQANWADPVLIKPHPMDKPEAYNELLAAYPTLQIALTNEPNFALMPVLRAGICFPGSSILDCDAFGVSAIELRPATDTFGPGKVVTTDYAESGYLSTSDIDSAVGWLIATVQPPLAEERRRTRSCGKNELDALLVALQASKESVLRK